MDLSMGNTGENQRSENLFLGVFLFLEWQESGEEEGGGGRVEEG